MSKRKAASPTPPAPTETPAATPSPALAAQAAPAAPRLQQTVNDEELMAGALKAISDNILSEPGSKADAENTEAPGDDEESVETPEIITDDNAPDDDDEADDKGDAAEETEAEDSATEDGDDAEAVADDDLAALATKTEAELDAHGKAKGWPASYTKRVKAFTRQLREAQAASETRLAALEAERDELRGKLEEPEGGSSRAAGRDGSQREPSHPETDELKEARDQERTQKLIVDFTRKYLRTFRNSAADPQATLEAMNRELAGYKIPPQTDIDAAVSWLEATETDAHDRWVEARTDVKSAEREAKRQAEAAAAAGRKRFEQSLAAAKANAAWLFEKNSPEKAKKEAAQVFIEANPGLTSLPDWPLIVALWVQHGPPAANGHANGNGAARKPAPAARAPGRPGAAAIPPSRSEGGLQAAHSKVMKTGSVEDATALLAKIL